MYLYVLYVFVRSLGGPAWPVWRDLATCLHACRGPGCGLRAMSDEHELRSWIVTRSGFGWLAGGRLSKSDMWGYVYPKWDFVTHAPAEVGLGDAPRFFTSTRAPAEVGVRDAACLGSVPPHHAVAAVAPRLA